MTDQLPSDPRTADQIVSAALVLDLKSSRNDEAESEYWNLVATLQSRGGIIEFDLAQRLLLEATVEERRLGADILGQLGWSKPTSFFDESVVLLIDALQDENEDVVASAAYGLGHRRSVRAIEPLLDFVEHQSVEVRRAVVHGLSCHDDRKAAEALERLCRDSDFDVRD